MVVGEIKPNISWRNAIILPLVGKYRFFGKNSVMEYLFLTNMAFADAIMGFDSNHLILYSVMPMSCKILGVGQRKDNLS